MKEWKSAHPRLSGWIRSCLGEPPVYTTDTRVPIPPRVMPSPAMGLNLGGGGVGFLPTTHANANAKQMRSRSSRAAQLLTRDCLHAQTAVHHAGNLRTWWTTIIWITRKPEDPQIEPHAEIMMAHMRRVWNLWFIYVGWTYLVDACIDEIVSMPILLLFVLNKKDFLDYQKPFQFKDP